MSDHSSPADSPATLLDQAGVLLLELDPAGRVRRINRKTCELLGRTIEQLLGQDWFAIAVPPELADVERRRLARLIDAGQTDDDPYECPLLPAGVGKCHVIWQDRLILDQDGAVTGVVRSGLATARPHLDTLKLHEQIAADIPDHVSMVDRDYVYRMVNTAYSRVHGLPRASIEGMRVDELFGRELFEGTIKPGLDRCFAGEVVRYEDWFRFPSVGRRFMSVIYTPYQHGDGAVAGAIVSSRDLTDQHLSQEALRDSESNYRSLFDNMLHGYAYCRMLFEAGESVDFIFQRVNRAFEVLSGMTNVEGHRADVLLPGLRQSNPEMFEIYGRVAKSGVPEKFESYVAALDRWFSISVYSPEPEHFVAIFDNITAHKRAQEALEAQQEQLHLLLDSMVEGIYGVDVEGFCTFVNSAALDMLGYLRPEDLVGRYIHNVIHHSHADGAPYAARDCRAYSAYRDKHGIHVDDEVFWRRDRSYFPVEYWSSPMIIGGEVIGSVVTFQDITQRRATEEKLRQAAKVFETTTEGVMITDIAGRLIAVNQAFVDITGYPEAEVLGKNPRLLKSGRHEDLFYQAMWAMLVQVGTWQGEIWNRRKNGEVYPEWLTINTVRDQAGKPINYVAVFSDISQVKQSEAKLEFLAHHDPLTSLPNRLLFGDRLEHALHRAKREHNHLAVLFIDLDQFKTVNDSLGHPVGDELLQRVARQLSSCVREEDTVARLGGDEFVVLLEQLAETSIATDVAKKILLALTQPHQLGGHALVVSASIGISTYPADGDDATTLLRNADTAMYQSKDDGRNTFRYYSAELTRSARERLTLEAELRRAIERQEFVLHFQPQVDVASRRIIGAEALVRWNHPENGLISPLRFIPLAEETGLIVPLGEWVLYAACEQYQAWQASGLPPITLAVNLSPRQFQQQGLVRQVRAILDATGMPPHLLELEITEGAIMERGEKARETLLELKSLGLKLAIDDFGTGYSSLAYLRRFPINVLKIDQSFMRDIPSDNGAMAIAATIIAMARNLHLDVLAEGVESEDQLAFLQMHGCDYAQGYLLSRPVLAESFAQLLQRGEAL